MKYFAAMLSVAIFIAIASIGYAQSLADIADKEKERREEIKQTPEAITNDQIPEYTGSISTSTPIEIQSAETDSEQSEEDAETADQEKKIDPDEPVDFMGRPESYWRETMTAAHKKVKELENEANVLTLRMNDLQTQFYNVDDGFSREATQKEIQKTYYEQDLNKENLAKAKDELEDLEKDARKSGALPGWFD
ncbi:MAG: hypothetical protein P8Y80_08695 [Acidobacteriota bacterium]